MDTRNASGYEAPQLVHFGSFSKLTLKQDTGYDLAMSQGCEENAGNGAPNNAYCLS